MPEKWTGNAVGLMHVHGIKADELAAKLGWHVKYLSTVLNGHRKPLKAENKVMAALNEVIAERKEAE